LTYVLEHTDFPGFYLPREEVKDGSTYVRELSEAFHGTIREVTDKMDTCLRTRNVRIIEVPLVSIVNTEPTEFPSFDIELIAMAKLDAVMLEVSTETGCIDYPGQLRIASWFGNKYGPQSDS
jgi:hypothetical protein